jgi:hypothetical protein
LPFIALIEPWKRCLPPIVWTRDWIQ